MRNCNFENFYFFFCVSFLKDCIAKPCLDTRAEPYRFEDAMFVSTPLLYSYTLSHPLPPKDRWKTK
jgi:hypothetical protein